MLGEQIKVISANCQGLRNKSKRVDVINYFKTLCPNIICLQDTHLTEQEETELKLLSKCTCLMSGVKTNSRGVAILFMNNFDFKILNSKADDQGNLIYADIEIDTVSLRLVNIYAPNVDNPAFFHYVNDIIEENSLDHLVLCGDFNLVLNPELDCSNYVSINNPKARLTLIETLVYIT